MATQVGAVWPLLTCFERAAEIARRGTRLVSSPTPPPARRWDTPRYQDTQAAAEAYALEADLWADGMTPDEYLLALVDRAQARTEETPDE